MTFDGKIYLQRQSMVILYVAVYFW